MIIVQKELIVSLTDLRYVSIQCKACRTKVTLDMEKPSDFQEKYNWFTPKECPACQTNYDSAIRPGLDSFQRAYKELAKIADQISFRGEAQAN